MKKIFCPRCKSIGITTELFWHKIHKRKHCAHTWWEIAYEFAEEMYKMTERRYIIVRHKPTGRAFSMTRGYMVFDEDLGIIEAPTKFVEDWDGWLTIHVPPWVDKLGKVRDLQDQFHAYWLY